MLGYMFHLEWMRNHVSASVTTVTGWNCDNLAVRKFSGVEFLGKRDRIEP